MPNNKLLVFVELGKPKIMIPVSLTGFTGYFMFEPFLSVKILLLSLGILLTAIAASVLNQIQEISIDSKMGRTCHRPLPSGRLKYSSAVVFFLVNLIAGIILIYLGGNIIAAVIGIMAICWYNLIYTYLKRITSFAVVPGAITGALPPLIGWVAAGGGLWDKTILFLEFLIIIGQVPHFWLLILRYGEEYKNAGLPSLTNVLHTSQIRRLIFVWVTCSVFSVLMLCYFDIIRSFFISCILFVFSLFVVWQFKGLLKTERNGEYSMLLNLYYLIVMIFIISDRIIVSNSFG
jgi:heme o synthase